MLAGWGTTCGKCRPNLVAPKTLFMSEGQASVLRGPAASVGMTLGWIVVSRSIDAAQGGALIELDKPLIVITRAGGVSGGSSGATERVVGFEDSFMSNGHALLRRPVSGARTDAFTISDRQDPGPSANGTLVNGRKLQATEIVRLSDGDTVKVGATELLFKSLWLPPASTRSA